MDSAVTEIVFEIAEDEVDGGYSASTLVRCGVVSRVSSNRASRRKLMVV